MGFLSDMSSLHNSTPTTSSGSGSSNPTGTLSAHSTSANTPLPAPEGATPSLAADDFTSTLTANSINKMMEYSSSFNQSATRLIQSNVDLYIADEVDGSFNHQSAPSRNITRSSASTVSPRLKQTNIPVLNVSNQPFDELVGVECAEEVMSSSDGFEVSTQAGSVSVDEVGICTRQNVSSSLKLPLSTNHLQLVGQVESRGFRLCSFYVGMGNIS